MLGNGIYEPSIRIDCILVNAYKVL